MPSGRQMCAKRERASERRKCDSYARPVPERPERCTEALWTVTTGCCAHELILKYTRRNTSKINFPFNTAGGIDCDVSTACANKKARYGHTVTGPMYGECKQRESPF